MRGLEHVGTDSSRQAGDTPWPSVTRAPVAGRAVVTWEGPGEPIVLAPYGPDGEVAAVPLLPKRALTLELLTCGVAAIKADQWDTPPPA